MILNDHDLFLHSEKLKELKYYKVSGNFKNIIKKLNAIIMMKENLYFGNQVKNELKLMKRNKKFS